MKCTNCGFEESNSFDFCPNCGAKNINVNTAHNIVLPAVKDVLFLVMCILLSAATVLTLINGDGIPVIAILVTIFTWLIYAKGTADIADSTQIKNLSGTIYASYVINNVVFIIFIVLGIIMSALLGAVSTVADFTNALSQELLTEMPDLDVWLIELISQFSWIIGVFLIVVGGVGVLINMLGFRKIHRFVKSVYQGIEAQTATFKYVRATRNWLIVFAVGYGLDIISEDITIILSAVCYTAAIILAVILINKYFLVNNKEA